MNLQFIKYHCRPILSPANVFQNISFSIHLNSRFALTRHLYIVHSVEICKMFTKINPVSETFYSYLKIAM